VTRSGAGGPAPEAPGPRAAGIDGDGTTGALVVGYGNALRGDDGLGWRVAALAEEDPRLRGATVLALHQLTPELAVDLSAASVVVLVDASAADEPGTISIRQVDGAAGASSASSHHTEPEGLAALARELWGAAPPVYVVSVGAASFDVGDTLSPAVELALPRVVDAVVALIEEERRA
jgi:hydrogenase maturation protease